MTDHTDPSPLAEAIAALPQHPPMRLLHRARHIDARSAVAEVDVRADALFLVDDNARAERIADSEAVGVPTWVALEYLGQTAALIGQAGAAPEAGAPALDGFLLGSRELTLDPEPFRVGETLTVSCTARGEVGDRLATFDGQVHDAAGRLRASGSLSVVRVPRDETPAGPAA